MKIFDTTFLVDFLRRAPEAKRLAQDLEDRGERPATTEVNAFELLLGTVSNGRVHPSRRDDIQRLMDRLDVLPLDRAGALRAAEIASKLRAEGRDLGALDALIAGIALASGRNTIVTRDESFRRVPGIRVETY